MKNKAFTLVELMVVIAIIAILAVGSVTSYTSYMRKANISKYKSQAFNNAKLRYTECLGETNCYFRTIIYEADGNLHRADGDSLSTSIGEVFVNE